MDRHTHTVVTISRVSDGVVFQIVGHIFQPINDAGDNGTRAEGNREEDRLDFL